MASNWVKLNVGGQLFDTTLTTLSSCPNSLLAKMFDPDSGFEPAYNKDGVYFLDADPKYFAVILNWLRYKAIMVDSDINVSNVAKVADYFGLEQLVKEIREIGAVVIECESNSGLELITGRLAGFYDEHVQYDGQGLGSCLGLYLKQTDNSYRQAGGKHYIYQASDGVWYISDTLTEKDGRLRNDTSTESNILPRTNWQKYQDEDDPRTNWQKYHEDEDEEWVNANLKIIDIKEFTFCNEITLSSTEHPKSEFLGKYGRMSEDWLNGCLIFKNKEGKYLGVNRHGHWYTGTEKNIGIPFSFENVTTIGAYGSYDVVTSCPAHVLNGPWRYRDKLLGIYGYDETFKIECDVHK